jgi:hypothetical protein
MTFNRRAFSHQQVFMGTCQFSFHEIDYALAGVSFRPFKR